jgi:hypothetical protein
VGEFFHAPRVPHGGFSWSPWISRGAQAGPLGSGMVCLGGGPGHSEPDLPPTYAAELKTAEAQTKTTTGGLGSTFTQFGGVAKTAPPAGSRRGGCATRFRDRSQAGGRRCRCVLCARIKVTAGRDGSPSPSLHGPAVGREPCPTSRGLGVDLDLVVEGLSSDRGARGRGGGVHGLFANANRAPATNPTGRATRSSRACPSCRACPRPSQPVWRPAPRRSPAGAQASW